MGKKVNIKFKELNKSSKSLAEVIKSDKFQPDLIVGIARGGLFLAQMLAYSLNVKDIKTVSIQFRDNANDTEFAARFKIMQFLDDIIYKRLSLGEKDISILFTDDLIDSGETINFFKNCLNIYVNQLPNEIKFFKMDARFAVSYKDITYKEILEDKFKVYAYDIKPNGWVVFPWDRI